MSLNLDNTLGDLYEENHDPEVVTLIREAAVGHGLPDSTPLRVAVQSIGFVVRPRYVLYINDRTANGQ